MLRAVSILGGVALGLLVANAASASSVQVSACNQFVPLEPISASTSGSCTNDTPNGPPGFGMASGDLASGQLRALAKGVFANSATASANFSDSITIIGNLAGPEGINISLGVAGVISGPAGAPIIADVGSDIVAAASFVATGAITQNNEIVTLRGYDGRNDDLTTAAFPAGTPGISTSFTSAKPSNIQFIILDNVTVDGAHPSFTFTASISAAAQPEFRNSGEDIVDFSNTATLALTLPAGLSFTSDSGVLLSKAGTPIPEPSTFTMMGLALVTFGLGYGMRRTRGARSRLQPLSP
jgi:hypothetical protein